jgi:uncharacterized protein
VTEALTAPLEIEFDYTRSLGPVLGEFMTALRAGRIMGAVASDGTVHAPPFEYDPITLAPPASLVPVGPAGTVLTWSWQPDPLDGQPLDHPFAWALIRLDGADTAMLHAVDAASPAAMRSGLRVSPRWADEPTGSIRDITCFAPEPKAGDVTSTPLEGKRCDIPSPGGGAGAGAGDGGELVTGITTPVRLSYTHTAAPGEAAFLRGLLEGRLIGQRCPACRQVYIPPRRSCPADGVPCTDEVRLPDVGTVTTFCIVNFPYPGQRIAPPFVAASILLDAADIAFQHLILGCSPDEVRMGMRVRAVWKPRDEWGMTLQNISHFEPTSEPDAPYEVYARHM